MCLFRKFFGKVAISNSEDDSEFVKELGIYGLNEYLDGYGSIGKFEILFFFLGFGFSIFGV